jgi:hypothetical protein
LTVPTGSSAAYVIDGDNVRGKSNFELSHDALLGRVGQWARRAGLSGCVLLTIDHGEAPTRINRHGIGISFSGPHDSADDLIAREVPTLMRQCKVVTLVTADSGLIRRCRAAARRLPGTIRHDPAQATAIRYDATGSSCSLHIVKPRDFLASRLGFTPTAGGVTRPIEAVEAAPNGAEPSHILALDAECRARSRLVRADRAAARAAARGRPARSHGRRKHRGQAQQRGDAMRAVDAAVEASRKVGAPLLEQVVGEVVEEGLTTARQEELMDALVARWESAAAAVAQQHPWQPELRATEDTVQRVVLAERLRRRLINAQSHTVQTLTARARRRRARLGRARGASVAVRERV